jgi:hypothetical protein
MFQSEKQAQGTRFSQNASRSGCAGKAGADGPASANPFLASFSQILPSFRHRHEIELDGTGSLSEKVSGTFHLVPFTFHEPKL